MRSRRRRACTLSGAWTTLALSLCLARPVTDAGPEPMRIGLLLPTQDAEAKSLRQGAEIAVAQANNAGTTAIELLFSRRPGQWGDEGGEAARLVLDDNVLGLIVPSSGIANHLALQVAGRTATPIISFCADNSVTGAGVPWVARIVPRTIDEATALMTHYGHKRWGALVPAGRAGREISRDLAEAAAAVGCRVDPVLFVEFEVDLEILASQFSPPGLDGLLLWLDPEIAALAVRRLKADGFKGVLAGPSRIRSDQYRHFLSPAWDGFVVAYPDSSAATGTIVNDFETQYLSTYNRYPDFTAAMACDAISLLLWLKAQSGDNSLYRQFPITGTIGGVTGLLAFDGNGNRLLRLALFEYRDRQWYPCQIARNHGPSSEE